MTLPAQQPQHPPARLAAAPDYHQLAWPLRADRACRTHVSNGILLPSPDESSVNPWEAQAFAEDTSSLTAGIWPPRSYPCSFCHREFKSAQALGGHMNVHRRDRARMRQSSPPALPFCAPQHISLQPAASIIHKLQHGYSSNSGDISPSAACPDIYTNDILSGLSTSQLPLPALSPNPSTASRAAARYPSHMSASFPLRLHLLASEAASTLNMLPEAEAMNQIALWPASVLDSGNGYRGSSTINNCVKLSRAANNSLSWKPSSFSNISLSSLARNANTPLAPSVLGAIPCKRARHVDVPLDPLDDGSPRKRCNNNSDYPSYNPDVSLTCYSKGGVKTVHADNDKHETLNRSDIHNDESLCMMQQEQVEACGSDCVDLELRLGQRPSYPSADYQTSASVPQWS